jgi:hypothetical protein
MNEALGQSLALEEKKANIYVVLILWAKYHSKYLNIIINIILTRAL